MKMSKRKKKYMPEQISAPIALSDVKGSDFDFVARDEKIFDKKFETKAVGYFRDAIGRFCKNKSSVVAFIILVGIILMSTFAPIFSKYDVDSQDLRLKNLPPRMYLLEKIGICDGTRKYKAQPLYKIVHNEANFKNKKFKYEDYISEKYGSREEYDIEKVGNGTQFSTEYITWMSKPYWVEKWEAYNIYARDEDGNILTDEKGANILLDRIMLDNGYYAVDIKYNIYGYLSLSYVDESNPMLTSDLAAEFVKAGGTLTASDFAKFNASDVNSILATSFENKSIEELEQKSRFVLYISLLNTEGEINELLSKYENITSIEGIVKINRALKPTTRTLTVKISPVKNGTMGPSVYHFFGTDALGRDMWCRIWGGTTISLLIGLCVAAATITIGIIWGAISGYYGGMVDMLMERFTEILGGIPYLIIMTLMKLYFGGNLLTVIISLILTSWIGTASSVRSQFYRYKGREYVLASRTMGASDGRLIFKHILPNSLGPIVTSSVLAIPSAIFFEATMSYLGIGIMSGNSIGKLLSEGQEVITTFPYLTIFPALLISVLMICFNMFGDGLRDALNPSLRGAE